MADTNDTTGTGSWYTPVADIGPMVERLRGVANSKVTHSIAWRQSQLHALLKLLEEHRTPLQAAVQADMGQGVHYCELFEINACQNQIQFALTRLKEWTCTQRVPTPFPTNLSQPVFSELTSYPRGLVLLMSPWNFPIALVLNPLINATAAGNCCVLKPSELSSNTSKLLGQLLTDYLDSEAIAVVQGDAQQATELLQHRWDAIAYTGGLRVAKIVAAAAAQHLTPMVSTAVK